PQSLYSPGTRSILAAVFADIVFGPRTPLGIPCLTPAPPDRDALARLVREPPQQEIDIDLTLTKPTIRFGDRTFTGEMPESTRRSLVDGQWDALAQLLDGREAVGKVAAKLPGPVKAP